tara:strand:+ start:157 stop:573 length:417 start_codon:yes stop_codon:yes gene_type:complete
MIKEVVMASENELTRSRDRMQQIFDPEISRKYSIRRSEREPSHRRYGCSYATYESLCGQYRVDFPDDEYRLSRINKDLLYRIKTEQCIPFYIEWQGESFVYVGCYYIYGDDLRGYRGEKVVGEGYGKHFGEYAIYKGN